MIAWQPLHGIGEYLWNGGNSGLSSFAMREAKKHDDEDSLALTWPPR